jgi:hypothetical protein
MQQLVELLGIISISNFFHVRWVIGGKARGKEPLGRPRHRWADTIRMDIRQVRWVMWTGLA